MDQEILIKVVTNQSERRSFIRLPWDIYRDDPNWVPPLIYDMANTLNPKKNILLKLGPYRFFLAYKDGKVVGRIGAGMDYRLNEAKGVNLGYITLFEVINEYEVAVKLFSHALRWLKDEGAEIVTGPQSPSNGDDYRGLLVEGFDSPPVLLNSYNPPYYQDFFTRYGFDKQFDRYAYHFDLNKGIPERFEKIINNVQSRFAFKARKINLRDIKKEIMIIKGVVDQSMPEWPDMIPPSMDELEAETRKLVKLAIADLIILIENNEGQCLGFSIALPDYNQVLIRLNGRLFPFGFIKFLLYSKRISGARMFALFVTPQGRRRGVSAALYYHTMKNALKLGYCYGEGSTIHEFNRRMNLDAQKAGGKLYKTYRIYQMKL